MARAATKGELQHSASEGFDKSMLLLDKFSSEEQEVSFAFTEDVTKPIGIGIGMCAMC